MLLRYARLQKSNSCTYIFLVYVIKKKKKRKKRSYTKFGKLKIKHKIRFVLHSTVRVINKTIMHFVFILLWVRGIYAICPKRLTLSIYTHSFGGILCDFRDDYRVPFFFILIFFSHFAPIIRFYSH